MGFWAGGTPVGTRTVDLPGTTQSETVMINMNVTNSYAYGGRAMCFFVGQLQPNGCKQPKPTSNLWSGTTFCTASGTIASTGCHTSH
jgi:hypothetical protein